MPACYLGLDVGTTAVKAALVDGDERVLAVAAAPSPQGPDGCVAQAAYLDAAAEVFRQLAEAHPNAWRAVEGLCVCGQGDGLFPVDRRGAPMQRAYTWQTARAAAEAVEINRIQRAQSGACCNDAFAGSRLALLLWLKREDPAAYGAIGLALTCVPVLVYMLTGVAASDGSNAGEAFDLLRGAYAAAVYDACGMADALPLLPKILPADGIAGRVTAKAAARFGLPAGLPVSVGCLDVTAAALGMGLPGCNAGIVLGTSLSVSTYRDAPLPPVAGAFTDLVPFSRPRWRTTLSACAGMGAQDYVQRLLYPDASYDTISRLAAGEPARADGPLFLPYLHGERAPFSAARATGTFLGLRPGDGAAALLRAAMEGVAFAARHCAAQLPGKSKSKSGNGNGPVVLSGGGARSAALCGILADVLQRPVVPCREECGAIGCVRLMKAALGQPAAAEAREAETEKAVLPNGALAAVYDQKYARFLRATEALRPFWAQEQG